MGKHLKILIVEDSEDDMALLLRQLQRDGYEPDYIRVEDDQSLQNALNQNDWDIIISDYVLPQYSGLDVLRYLKGKSLDIPCVIVSGKITDETAVAAMKSGAKDYIMKDNLKRLGSIIERELSDIKVRRERAMAEEELEVTRTSFRKIILNDVDGVLVTDAQGLIRFLNPAAERLFGRPASKIINTRFDYPLDSRVSAEIELVRQDGIRIIVDVRVSETEWEGEKAFLATLRDNTDRKKMEQALQESNEFSTLMMHNAPNPIVVANTDGSIRYVNPSLEALTGYTSKDLIGTPPPFPWWPAVHRRQHLSRYTREMGTSFSRREMQFTNRNGECFWVEVTSTPIRNQFGDLLFVLYSWIDVTEQKRLTEELEYYARKVTEAQEEERARIARELHDDTAQSLAVLSMEMDALLTHNQDLSDEVTQHLRRIKEGADLSLQEVRRFSHELRPSLLDNLGLLAAIEQLIVDGNGRNDLAIQFDVTGKEKRLAPDIELSLFRIIQESLNNVRKHAQATRASISLDFHPHFVRLKVADNGRGFDRHIEKTAIANGHMGLIGMKERARLAGALLKLDSKPGKGTVITVELDLRAHKKSFS